MSDPKYVGRKLSEEDQKQFGHKYTIESNEDNFFADSVGHALELEAFLNACALIEATGLEAIKEKYA